MRVIVEGLITCSSPPRDVLVTSVLITSGKNADQHLDNVLASPQGALTGEKFERFDASFIAAGDTLSAALAALLASGSDLVAAAGEALSYMDRCLDAGFRPGMGHVLPDRLFWAQPEDEDDDEEDGGSPPEPSDFGLPPHDTRH